MRGEGVNLSRTKKISKSEEKNKLAKKNGAETET